jgi:hypothetical protein
MRSLLALTLLSIATTAGCAEWKALLEDALDGQDGAGKSGGTGSGADGGAGGAPGASLTCDAVSNADGTVCKRCVDASGAVVSEECPSGTSNGGSAGRGGTTSGGADAGSASGGAIACDAYTNAAGASCKRCVDASGVVLSDECPPPPPPTTCTKLSDGGPSSCKDAATWKQYGATACAQLGMSLSDIAYGTPCGSNFQDVVYVCCGAAAPSCSVDVDALGNTCKTCWDATGAVVESGCQASGVTCESSAGTDGATCKTCKYPDGRIFSAECSGGATGGTEICDVKTNADGTVCKVCYEPDGTTTSSCP